MDAGKTTKGITAELLNDAAIKFAGRPRGWSQARVDSALDSYSSVINRQSMGSPSPAECDKMVATMKIRLAADHETFTRFASMVTMLISIWNLKIKRFCILMLLKTNTQNF